MNSGTDQSPHSDHDPDLFKGVPWAELATRGYLGAVLDPADTLGTKNAYIDRLQRIVIRSTLAAHRGKRRALDFGCGTGRMLNELSNVAAEVYGVDRTPAMLDVARQLAVVPPDRLVCWREGPLPFPDGHFDLILSVGVISTLAQSDLDSAVAQLRRVCDEAGALVLLEKVHNGERGLRESKYHDVLSNAGFSVLRAMAVRKGGCSMFCQLAARHPQPPWVAELCARAELMMMRYRRYAGEQRYWDYLFVATPRK